MAFAERIKTLQELSNVTYSCLKVDPAQMSTSFNSLGDNADEPALVPWVITQRVDAAQKVQLSIKCGLHPEFYVWFVMLIIVISIREGFKSTFSICMTRFIVKAR